MHVVRSGAWKGFVSLEECTMENLERSWRQEIKETSVAPCHSQYAVPHIIFVCVLLGDTQNEMLGIHFGTIAAFVPLNRVITTYH